MMVLSLIARYVASLKRFIHCHSHNQRKEAEFCSRTSNHQNSLQNHNFCLHECTHGDSWDTNHYIVSKPLPLTSNHQQHFIIISRKELHKSIIQDVVQFHFYLTEVIVTVHCLICCRKPPLQKNGLEEELAHLVLAKLFPVHSESSLYATPSLKSENRKQKRYMQRQIIYLKN